MHGEEGGGGGGGEMRSDERHLDAVSLPPPATTGERGGGKDARTRRRQHCHIGSLIEAVSAATGAPHSPFPALVGGAAEGSDSHYVRAHC